MLGGGHPIGVVASSPARDVKPCFPQREDLLLIQAIISQPPIEAFEVTVPNGLARLNEEQVYAAVRCPGIDGATAKLASIFQRPAHRLSTCVDRGFVRDDHGRAREAVRELVAHEFDVPHVIRTRDNGPWYARHREPLSMATTDG